MKGVTPIFERKGTNKRQSTVSHQLIALVTHAEPVTSPLLRFKHMGSEVLPIHEIKSHRRWREKTKFIRVIGMSVLLLLVYYYQTRQPKLYHIPIPDTPVAQNTEAYVTFLSDIETEPWYGHTTRLLLFQLVHDPLTRDTSRDFVVLTTPRVSPDFEDILRSEGAIVIRKPFIENMPDQYASDIPHNWVDQYSKLHVFNFTQYSRILYLDNDMTLTRSLAPLWDTPEARPETGLAACGWNEGEHEHPPRTDGHFDFNAGFFITYPNATLFEELLKVTGYHTGNREQALLVEYFHPDGPRPWVQLSRGWTVQWAQEEDVRVGVATLHDKFWQPWGRDAAVAALWRQKLGRMEGFWLAKKALNQIVPNQF